MTLLDEKQLEYVKSETTRRETEAKTKVRVVGTINPATPHNLVVDQATQAIEALIDWKVFAEAAGLPDPTLKEWGKFYQIIQDGINFLGLPSELDQYLQAYEGYLLLQRQQKKSDPPKTEGFFSFAYEKVLGDMDAAKTAAVLVGWPEFNTKFDQTKKVIEDTLSHNVSEAFTLGIENPGANLADSVTRVLTTPNLDTLYSTAPPPTVDLSIGRSDLETLVGGAANKVDAKTQLDENLEVKRLQDVQREVSEKEKQFRTIQPIIEVLVPLKILTSEILDRNARNKVEEFDQMELDQREEAGQIGYYLRPKTDYLEFRGRDQVKLFLDLVGREGVERVEELAIKLAKASPDKKKSILHPGDIDYLQKLAIKLNNLSNEYVNLSISPLDPTDPTVHDITSGVVTASKAHVDWIFFILEEAGQADIAEATRRGLEEPNRQAALEKWQDYFTEIARGKNGLKDMEVWAGKLMTVFYPPVDPKEPWRKELEGQRFGAWVGALQTVEKERLAAHPTEAAEFKRLYRRFDGIRKVTDALITYAQHRSITADWHDEKSRDEFATLAIAQRDFNPVDLDFFVETDQEKQRTGEGYQYAPQFIQVLEWIKQELTATRKGARFSTATGTWKSNNSSKVALMAELKQRLELLHSDIPQDHRAEIVETAYTTMCFTGFNLDAFAEIHILGFSPNVAEIAKRLAYYKTAPFVEFFYGAYKLPRFLIEMMCTYPPKKLIEQWKAKFATYNEADLVSLDEDTRKAAERGRDYKRRIQSIETSILMTHEVFKELVTLRLFDEQPMGYSIGQYEDGMLRWPFPSMYRFLFDPEIGEIRKKNEFSFVNWAEGYKGFVKFRDSVYANISTEGKDPKAAVNLLMDKLEEVTNNISGLKVAQALIDWNYIYVLTVSFVDRMFISLAESGNNTDAAREELFNRASKIFGFEGTIPERALQAFALAGLEEETGLGIEDAGNKQNLNTASPPDQERLKLPEVQTPLPRVTATQMDPAELKRQVRVKLMEIEKRSKVSFAEAVKREIRETDENKGKNNSWRRRMKYQLHEALGHNWLGQFVHFIQDRNLKGLMMKYPDFEKTIDFVGKGSSSTAEQAKAVGEKEAAH